MCLSNLFGAYASYEQGKYLDKVAQQNAIIQERAAEDALQRGSIDADEQRKRTQQIIGAQRTAIAAGGIDVNSGTAGQLQSDTAALGELDALTIMNNAAREAYGYRVQAIDTRQQGQLARYQGRTAAIGSILGGAEKAAAFGYSQGLFGGAGGAGGASG